MDYWSTMGKGIDWAEVDKIRQGWITEQESKAFMRADRAVAQETTLVLYPADRPESKGNLMVFTLEI